MRSRTLRQVALLALGCSVIGFGSIAALAAGPSAAPPGAAPSPAPVASNVPLEWSAPEGCPGRAEVLDRLTELLDADRTSWDRFETVRGRITRGEAAFELELELILGRRVGRRSFATRDCADLAQAAAATLALVLDPAWDWDREPSPAPEAATPSAPSSEVDSSSAADPGASDVAREPRPSAPVELQLGAEGVLDATTLGRSAFGLGLLGRARLALGETRVGAELFGTWLPAQSIDVRPTESVKFGLLAAGIRACNWPTVALGVCAELEAGRLSASGIGASADREAFDTWMAPGASVVLESRLFGALLLDSRVSLLAPLMRPKYFVNGTEGVHEVPAASVRVALGLALPVD